MLRSDNPFKSYSSLHILHWPVGVLSAPTHLRVYRLSPGGISKLTRYINCMQNFRLVARSEMFCTNNMDYSRQRTRRETFITDTFTPTSPLLALRRHYYSRDVITAIGFLTVGYFSFHTSTEYTCTWCFGFLSAFSATKSPICFLRSVLSSARITIEPG